VAAYEKSLELGPPQFETLANLGDAYHELGRLDDAKNALVRARNMNPTDAKLRRLLGQVYFELGMKDEAIAEHEALKQIDPQLAEKLEEILKSAS
jgi:tetratricopeptide (TPR) repeat protein